MFEQNYTPTQFTDLANYILNNIIISANGTKYRICEIEFYYHNKTHLDEYVHQSPDQKKYGKFYFHKFHNGTFKAGTFKGLDITLGNENTYFGILIRSIENINTNEFTEGSCNVTNKILGCFNVSNVKELFETHYHGVSQISITDDKLKLEKVDLDKEDIYTGPRIGLSEKYPDFKDKNYRFCTLLNKIKKQRKTMKKLEKEVEEHEDKIFLVCVHGQPNAFKNREDAEKFIKEENEPLKACKLAKDNLLFHHNNVDGYDKIEYFELENITYKVYILSSYYCKKRPFVSNEKIFYADSYEKILDIAKKVINDNYKIIRGKYEEELMERYGRDFLDPNFAFAELKKNYIFEIDEIGREHFSWKIDYTDVN